jgi:hypothetical protein
VEKSQTGLVGLIARFELGFAYDGHSISYMRYKCLGGREPGAG